MTPALRRTRGSLARGLIVCFSAVCACGGGPAGIRLVIEENVTALVVLGDGTVRGDIREISPLDTVSPQEVSVFAGFGDGDEIADEAVIRSENGKLTVDLREVADSVDRGFRFAISVRTPSRVHLERTGTITLNTANQGSGIRRIDLSSTRVSLDKPRSLDSDLQIQANDSAVNGRLRLRRLEIDAVDSQLSLWGLSNSFFITMLSSTLDSNSVGGREETLVDATDSDVREICSPGDLRVRARQETLVELDPSCSPESLSVDTDATSRVR
jgi:hypothetical protein